MTAYVTPARRSGKGALKWAHLTADTEAELDLMAARLQLQPGFRFYATATVAAYFLITPAQRAAALSLGAQPAITETTHRPAAGPDDQIDLFEAHREGTR